MSILVLNAGSSSLKFGWFDRESLAELCSGRVEEVGTGAVGELIIHRPDQPTEHRLTQNKDHCSALNEILAVLHDEARHSGHRPISAIGQRVVHGGSELTTPVLIDDAVLTQLERLAELAPLHNPPALSVIRAVERALPQTQQVAVFDTAFFANLPLEQQLYPLPYEWFTDLGIRRFGFHGISHAYCTLRAAEFLGRSQFGLKLIICHLGNGCSASAVRNGVPVATTMGYTPLEGLMMGTRSGSIDPGILLRVQHQLGLSGDEVEHILQKESGLLGVSGVSSDFRQVEAAAEAGNMRARLAIAMYGSRITNVIGGYAALLGGVDAVIFTAGVGEHAHRLREVVCHGLEFMGLHLDRDLNRAARTDADIATLNSPARILILKTREDWMIAQEAQRLIPSV